MNVETNAWRCTKPCKNCPLMDNGKSMHLEEGRVDAIKVDLEKGNSFSCHVTVYESDEQQKLCYGAFKHLKDINKPNQIMQVAKRLGYE